jgi:hypothetical protein
MPLCVSCSAVKPVDNELFNFFYLFDIIRIEHFLFHFHSDVDLIKNEPTSRIRKKISSATIELWGIMVLGKKGYCTRMNT